MKTKLIKIGGKVLALKNGLSNLDNIAKSPNRKIVVFSAFGKLTRQLSQAAHSSFEDLDKSYSFLNKIEDDVLKICKNYLDEDVYLKTSTILNGEIEDLKKYLKAINITKELSPKFHDHIIAHGEIITGHVLKSYLSMKNYDFQIINSWEYLTTDENYSEAKPDYETSKDKFEKSLSKYKSNLILTHGFIAADNSGNYTTMGYESSNLTALLIAKFLNIKEVDILTDVDGIYNIDPQVGEGSKFLNINYKDAYKAAINGLKLIYPDMINYAASEKIKINIGNYLHKQFTTISGNETTQLPLIIISNTGEITFLFLDLNKISNIIDELSTDLHSFSYKENTFKIQFKDFEKEKLIKAIQDII